MTRQKKGFYLTLVAQLALILIYLAAFVFHWTGNPKQMALGFMLTLMPLLYFLPGVWRRQGKPYAALALLAPLHLFFGGVIHCGAFPFVFFPFSCKPEPSCTITTARAAPHEKPRAPRKNPVDF